MNENILVTIIAPVYKIPYELLRKSIEHMISQTHKKTEIILIDDGSPDNCGKICDEYAKIDKRVNVIHTRNAGVSHARNTGIKYAKGEYICFVDSDDFLEPTAIEIMLSEAVSEDAELVVCNYTVSGKRKNTSEKKYVFLDDDILKIKKSFISGGRILGLDFTGAPWGKLYKTAVIKDNKCYFDESLPRSQDNEFNFRYADLVKKCVYIDICLYTYNIYENSAMRKYWKAAEKNADILLEKIKKDIYITNNPEYYQDAYYKFIITKILDILQTDIVHPENNITKKERISRIRSLANREPYISGIKRVTNESIKSYRGLIVKALKEKNYYLVYIIVKLKSIIKAIMK